MERESARAADPLTDVSAAEQTNAQLREALESRHVIGMAQGILIARYGLSIERAFEFLRRLSQDNNTKLKDVAAAVVRDCLAGREQPPGPTATDRDQLRA